MRKIIESYDEEYEESFANRAGKELTKALNVWMKRNKTNLCNDEVLIICEVIKK